MSNYTPSTDFSAKDALLPGNPSKVIRGTEISAEFSAVQTAVTSKYDADSIIPVSAGGTGVNTLTGVVKGNGTGAMTPAVAGTDYLAPAAIGVTVQAYNANNAVLNVAQSFTAAQRGAVSTLTDGATITPDFAVANNFSVTLGGNRTLANPTNVVAGQSGVIKLVQDGTGSRTLAFGSSWDWSGGSVPTLTTTAGAVDLLAYYVDTSTNITARLIADRK